MNRYDLLWQALAMASSASPSDRANALSELVQVGCLPSPWVTWTLIGLVRHLRRQYWVGEIVSTRLGADLKTLARKGALGHPSEREPTGVVPGLPEWEYAFHGRGCRLSHRVTGEAIDVDFFGPTADGFDEWFYLDYLRSLRQPESAEERLLALHPSINSIKLAIDELRGGGLLVPYKGGSNHIFRLSREVLDQVDAVDAFCRGWQLETNRAWLAALIGDWLGAHEFALFSVDEPLARLIGERATSLRERRRDDLLSDRDGGIAQADALFALADLDDEVLTTELDRALQGEIGVVTRAAIEIIRRRNEGDWCPALHRLIPRLDPAGPLPHPYLWLNAVEFLLIYGYHAEEARALLVRTGGPRIGAAALLALEYAPGSALPLFRRALRSRIPMNRIDAAAVLAAIDRPWSRDELIGVLRESNEQEATAECRAALRECHDVDAHLAVELWENQNPHEPSRGPGITMGEMILRNTPWWIRHRMDEFHDRVMTIRQRVPDQVAGAG